MSTTTNPFKGQIEKSNRRGYNTIAALRKLITSEATGLDNEGMRALLVLVEEFAKNGRREFLS